MLNRLTRRTFLQQAGNGFGMLALASLLQETALGETPAGLGKPHFAPRAKNVIFLYMDGGPSQVDTFDYKPMLEKYNGQDPKKIFKVEPTQFDNIGKVMASPWKFKKYGESGRMVSDLFPYIAKHVDEMAFVHSLTSKFPEHTSANYFLHTGSGIQGRPSMGAWVGYGLGSESKNLPGFIVLNGGLIPPGGLDNFNSGFLPAAFQGSVFKAGNPPVANVVPLEPKSDLQKNKLALLKKLDEAALKTFGHADEIESAIKNYETAFQMQSAVPELMDIAKESEATQKLYGIDSKYGPTKTFGTQCLIARRLIERGVRFIELTCPSVGTDRWDQHDNLKSGHEKNCLAVDQPISGLLTDLKAKGLLKETLVVWGGEFGRTPFAQGANGRDHNQYGFTVWMAGGGVKGGVANGETDEFGYKAVKDKWEIHDLHATILHLMGLDHTKLTFRFGGRDMRLTDVHGEVMKPILA